MKFSIIIITYNSELKKIKATLESVLRQSFKDYEVIIADDGSQDNYFDELKEYMVHSGFYNYKFIDHEKNVGTVRNLLSAVEAARGEYVRDFGPGDLFYSEKSLEMLCSFMDEKACECCFGLVRGYHLDGEERPVATDFYHPFDIRAYKGQKQKRLQKNLVLYRDYPPGACTSYKRTLYLNYLRRLSGKVRYTEDIFQIMAGLDNIFMDCFPDYLVWYETDSGVSNIGGVYSERMLKDVERFYKLLYRKYPDNGYVKKQRRVFGLYRVRNLYIRTLLRLIVNPTAAGYLVNHIWQIKRNEYRPKHMVKGFLDDKSFFERIG